MNELDQLKNLWNRTIDENQQKPIDPQQIEEMIGKKSSGPVDKLKRSLKIEIAAILIAIPMLLWVMFELPRPFFIVNSIILIGIFLSIMIYYYLNLQKIVRIWSANQFNIKKSIESTLMMFRFYRKTYFWLNIILFPIGLYIGFQLGFGIGSGGEIINNLPYLQQYSFWQITLAAILGLVALLVLFWLILKFYMAKLYDVHIKKLEGFLLELESVE